MHGVCLCVKSVATLLSLFFFVVHTQAGRSHDQLMNQSAMGACYLQNLYTLHCTVLYTDVNEC